MLTSLQQSMDGNIELFLKIIYNQNQSKLLEGVKLIFVKRFANLNISEVKRSPLDNDTEAFFYTITVPNKNFNY